MLIFFPADCDGRLSLSPAISKPIISSITNEDVTFPHSHSHLNCSVFTDSPEQLVLSRPTCSEISDFASMIKVVIICRNSSCSACRHLLQDLNHLFLEYLPLSLYANHVWVCSLHPGVWLNCCVSAKFFCFSSLGRSWVAPSLKRPASKIRTMQHALPIVENNQAFVPNMKKSTFMQR